MDASRKGKATPVEDGELDARETWKLPLKKRSHDRMAVDVKTEEGCGSIDSTAKVDDAYANLGEISEHSDSSSDSDLSDCESCECCVESGYVADGEAEGLSYRWYPCGHSTVATHEEPARKRRAEGHSEKTVSA